MSFVPTLLPSLTIPIDLGQFISNYYIVRSFQRNWSTPQFIHIPTLRPVLHNVAAGDHYFEWRPQANSPPLVSLIFILHPSCDFEEEVVTSKPATLFQGTHIVVLCAVLPSYLPAQVEDLILKAAENTRFSAVTFIRYLDLFCQETYRPISPIHIPAPLQTSPLEEE